MLVGIVSFRERSFQPTPIFIENSKDEFLLSKRMFRLAVKIQIQIHRSIHSIKPSIQSIQSTRCQEANQQL